MNSNNWLVQIAYFFLALIALFIVYKIAIALIASL